MSAEKRDSKKESNGNCRALNIIFEIKNSLCMFNSIRDMTEKRLGELQLGQQKAS